MHILPKPVQISDHVSYKKPTVELYHQDFGLCSALVGNTALGISILSCYLSHSNSSDLSVLFNMSVKSLDTVIDLDKNEKNKQNVDPTMRMNRLRVKSGSNDRLFKTLSKCEDYNGVITISELEKDIRDSSKSTKVRGLLLASL